SCGHLHPRQSSAAVKTVIYPVFIMMFVPAFVVEPGGRIALCLSFRIIGTSCSLIISASHFELCPAVFRQIMQNPLSVQPNTEAFLHDQSFMFCNCTEMLYCLH